MLLSYTCRLHQCALHQSGLLRLESVGKEYCVRTPPGQPSLVARRPERPWPVQFVIFCLVGIGNAAIDALTFTLLVLLAGWDHGGWAVAASIAGFSVGAVHSYAWNSRVTFSGRRRPSIRVGRFLLIIAIGATISAIVFSLVWGIWWTGTARLVASKAGAMGATALWNFTLLRGWVFTRDRLALE